MMAIWKEPIFNRTEADVSFAIRQIEAWKSSHTHKADIVVTPEAIVVESGVEVVVNPDSVAVNVDHTRVENGVLVVELGNIYDLKGCLNLSDIIRIEDNISYMAEHLAEYLYPIEINTRVWTKTSLPNLDDMKRIASNIHSIFENFYDPRETGEDGEKETVPDRMLSYQDINTIEHYLYILKQMLDCMKSSFISSGTRCCGERGLPLRRSI